MATPRSRQAARLRARRRRAQQRARWLAVLAVVGVLGLVTLRPDGLRLGHARTQRRRRAPRRRRRRRRHAGPQALATVSNLRIQLPVSQGSVTGIGYHGTRNGALTLHPARTAGQRGTAARLWHRIVGNPVEDPSGTSFGGRARHEVLNVGAAAGTDVYSPVNGTMAAISDYVLDGRVVGARIDIRPTLRAAVIVSLSHLLADPSLSVGSPVMAASSKIGTVAPISAVERQALARFTNDAGDNVAIEVYPAATSLP